MSFFNVYFHRLFSIKLIKMSTEENKQSKLLPHHEQQDLCTTRLPYRQGRKLTAVKVYTINNESKHLLIFGVPSLNLRQETKSLFMKLGKLLQFNVTDYPSEQFTETYHAVYESIQSARIAKKMLDTKNYYGGHLHVCYAPELETVDEVKEKILQRKTQVTGRLRNLAKEAELLKQNVQNKIEKRLSVDTGKKEAIEKIDMGSVNTIVIGKRKQDKAKKKSMKRVKIDKFNLSMDISDAPVRFDSGKTESIENIVATAVKFDTNTASSSQSSVTFDPNLGVQGNMSSDVDVIDFTSTQTEVISNINEALNYNSFGSEIIKKVPRKPVNKIKFNFNKKS